MEWTLVFVKKNCTLTKKASRNEHRMIANKIKIIQGDCLEKLDKLYKKNGEFVDLVFCDPPYFLSNGGISCQNGKMVKVDKGDWDKSRGVDLNHEFNLEWLKRCQKVLKPNGTIMVSGTFHVIYSVGFAMQQLHMKLLNNITWEKPNPPPNLSCRYLTHSTETIIWAAKNKKSKHKFNYDIMREINGGKQMKDVWQMKPPKREEKNYGKHPTQKPLELLRRLITVASDSNDLVLDAFNGSGTTGIACLELNRRYVGIEMEAEYVELSKKRIQEKLDQIARETPMSA